MADDLDPGDPIDALILERIAAFRTDGSGYIAIQNTRPQTVSYGFTDSPVAQLTWIAESFERWTDLPIDRDQLLTNISLYWFTRSAPTAAGFLYEQAHSNDWGSLPQVPQGYAVFGADRTVRRILRPPADTHWTEFERGGHFPAMELPRELAADLRSFFTAL